MLPTTPRGATEFRDVSCWRGYLDPAGTFHVLMSYPRMPPRVGVKAVFDACTIDGKLYAVFGEFPLDDAIRAEIAATRPSWLHAIIYATARRSPEPAEAIIEATIEASDGADPISCGFAAACIVAAEGRMDFHVDFYLVQFPGRLPMDVVVEVNYEDHSRFGYVREFEP